MREQDIKPMTEVADAITNTEEKEKPYWDVTISTVENGFIVKVGCKTFILEGSFDRLLANLDLYFNNFSQVKNAFYQNKLELI